MAQILVVDDDEGVRSFLAEALELDEHDVVQAVDGNDALAQMQRRAFEVVVTDLTMSGLDGMSLLRRAKQDQPEVEFVMLTAYGSIESAVAAMKAGAFDYLQKPLGGPAELRIAVQRALEHRALVDFKGAKSVDTDEIRLGFGSVAMQRVEDTLKRVATSTANVLLLGESGTGKEVAARAVHAWSDRKSGPFVAVNCAALSETLLESELFGHEKGAFTGATSQRRGRIELASAGTFFLDEVGELAPKIQAKLLRVLQEREFERVGGSRTIKADVRWVAATNRDLKAMISDGSFREDLYHRLAVFPIRLPALRERPEDILPLAAQLLRTIGRDLGRARLVLSPGASEVLSTLEYRGNVRELRNTLERAAILARGEAIEVEDLWLDAADRAAPSAVPVLPEDLASLERVAIERALAVTDGNRRLAAERLGIGLRTLYEKLKRYGLE